MRIAQNLVLSCLRDNTAISKRDAIIIALLGLVGLRRREIAELRTLDFLPDDEMLYIGGQNRRIIQLDKLTSRIIKEWLDICPSQVVLVSALKDGHHTYRGGKLTTAGIRDVLLRRSVRHGFGRITPHTLRRMLIKDSLENGEDPSSVTNRLGYRSIDTLFKNKAS